MTVRDDLAQLARAQAAGANIAPFGPGGDRDAPDFPSGPAAADLLVRRKRSSALISFQATDNALLMCGYFPVAAKIVAITIISPIAIAQSDTDYQTVDFIVGAPGPTSATVATFTTETTGGIGFLAKTPRDLVLTDTTADLIVPQYGTLRLESAHTAYGADFSGCTVVVTYDETGDEVLP